MTLISTQYDKIVNISHVQSIFLMQRISAEMITVVYLMAELDTMELICMGAFQNTEDARSMLQEIHNWFCDCDKDKDTLFAVAEMADYMHIQLFSERKENCYVCGTGRRFPQSD